MQQRSHARPRTSKQLKSRDCHVTSKYFDRFTICPLSSTLPVRKMLQNGEKKEKGILSCFFYQNSVQFLNFVRNFPTAANVLRKKQLQEKREKQGDVANTPLYRY